MDSTEKGFHCKSCDHTLTDFRGKTSEEINAVIRENNGKTCGIFNNNQFDYKVSQAQIPAYKAIGFSLLGILGFLGPVLTSCESEHPEIINKKKDAFKLLKFPMNISGTVKDDKTNAVVPHFKVEILQKGKVIKTALTDENGNFTIKINRQDLKVEQFKLAFGGFNYYQDTISTNLSKFENQKVRLTIQAESVQIPEPSDSRYTISTITSGSVLSGFAAPAKEETHILEGVAMEAPVTAGIPLPGECEPEKKD